MYLLWGRRPVGRVERIENLRRFSKMKPCTYLKTCQILTTPLLGPYKLCKVLYSLTWTSCYINMSSYALNKFLQVLKPSINTPSIHVNNSNPASHLILRKHEGQISFIHLEHNIHISFYYCAQNNSMHFLLDIDLLKDEILPKTLLSIVWPWTTEEVRLSSSATNTWDTQQIYCIHKILHQACERESSCKLINCLKR
jgi:hypothetical protein